MNFHSHIKNICRQAGQKLSALLKKFNSQRNLQVLMTEVCKTVNGRAPPIMNSLFQFRCNTNNIR